MVITFCGHSEIPQKERFSAWLGTILPSLIEGGAAKTLAFAQKKQKVILQYPNREPPVCRKFCTDLDR